MTEEMRRQDQQQASREASLWMIRLQEAPHDDAVVQAFEAWRAAPENAAAWAEHERMTKALAGVAPAHAAQWKPFLDNRDAADLPADKQTLSLRSSPQLSRRRMLQAGGFAAAACLVAAVAVPIMYPGLHADYRTATGQSRTLALADGSVITLAPQSAIDIAMRDGERRIHLIAGEAFFEVAPDQTRPFKVTAKNIAVTVLGTDFDVARGEKGAYVGVAHGAVRVDRNAVTAASGEYLAAGDTVHMSWAGEVSRKTRPVALIAPWRQNKLIVEDEPLSAVVDKLRRYYSGKIVVTNAHLARQPVTGVYDLSDPMRAIAGIAHSQNAKIRRVTPWIVVISPS